MSSAVLGNYTASVHCADVKKDFQARNIKTIRKKCLGNNYKKL